MKKGKYNEAQKTLRDKESLQRQISAADHEIDRLVYELYLCLRLTNNLTNA